MKFFRFFLIKTTNVNFMKICSMTLYDDFSLNILEALEKSVISDFSHFILKTAKTSNIFLSTYNGNKNWFLSGSKLFLFFFSYRINIYHI